MSTGNLVSGANQFPTPAASPGQHYDLRPLSTGEVLDRTFQIYRSHFALFAGLALLPTAVRVLTSAMRLIYAAHQDTHLVGHVGTAFDRAQIFSVGLALVSSLISMVLYGLTQAATTWAVSAVYLNEEASIKSSYGFAFKHWFRYTVIVLRQIWAFMWLPMLLFMAAGGTSVAVRNNRSLGWLAVALFVLAALSFIYGVWAFIRISLAVPAAVVESLKVRPAVRRSAQLLASRKIRIFLLLLMLVALYAVVGMFESPLVILMVRSRGTQNFVVQGISLAVGFVAGTLIGPVGAIGVCLFYFDERVRREGFDIEWMMKKLAPADAGGVNLSAPPQGSSPEPA